MLRVLNPNLAPKPYMVFGSFERCPERATALNAVLYPNVAKARGKDERFTAQECVYMHACMYARTYIRTYLPTYIHTYPTTYIHIAMCNVYIYVYVYAYVYIHISTHGTYTIYLPHKVPTYGLPHGSFAWAARLHPTVRRVFADLPLG